MYKLLILQIPLFTSTIIHAATLGLESNVIKWVGLSLHMPEWEATIGKLLASSGAAWDCAHGIHLTEVRVARSLTSSL